MLIRRRLRMNQAEFGKHLGVSREWVSRTENASGPVEVSTEMAASLHQLTERTNVSVEEEPADYRVTPRPALPSAAPVIAEPSVTDLRDLFDQLVDESKRVPGGIFNLTRALRRYRAEYLNDDAITAMESAARKLEELKRRARESESGLGRDDEGLGRKVS